MTINEIIKKYSCQRRDIELLLQHVLACDRSDLIKHSDRLLTGPQSQQFSEQVARFEQGEPIAYIIGYQAFWSFTVEVNPSVLIPRPDTELLVETVLNTLPKNKKIKILELGVGSGVIAIALKSERPEWQVSATDICANALQVAQKNASLNNVAINFIKSNWFESISSQKFDAIISNPPYIESDDLHLKNLTYEPQGALTSGVDGLDAIRHIIANAKAHLNPGGYLMLEHGYKQQAKVIELMQQAGFQTTQSLKDLAGNDRAVVATASSRSE